MITLFNSEDIGKRVVYTGGAGEKEYGRLKSFNNENRRAWVVYETGGVDMRFYREFTGQSTSYDDLEMA